MDKKWKTKLKQFKYTQITFALMKGPMFIIRELYRLLEKKIHRNLENKILIYEVVPQSRAMTDKSWHVSNYALHNRLGIGLTSLII